MEKVVPWGGRWRFTRSAIRRHFIEEALDQSKFELMIDGANVLTPSVDFREPPRQQNPFAVVEDGTARRERQWSAHGGCENGSPRNKRGINARSLLRTRS